MLKKFLAYLQSNTKKHTKLQHRGKYFVEAFTGKRKFYLFLLPYRKVCQQATATMCWTYAAYPSRALHRVYTECSFLHRLQRNPPHTCQIIPPIQHNPNQTRSYSVHGYSTFSKKSLKFNKFVYVKVKAWIMQPLDFSRGSYFKGEALQSNIDPSICNSNPDSRLSLGRKKIAEGTAHFTRSCCLLVWALQLQVIYLLTQLTSALQYIQVPLSRKFSHNAEFVTWQLLKSALLRCTSAAYLH